MLFEGFERKSLHSFSHGGYRMSPVPIRFMPFLADISTILAGVVVLEQDMAYLPWRCKSAIDKFGLWNRFVIMGDSEGIGQRIRVLRQKLNYTQIQVEKATGIPQSNLSEFENGKLIPTIQTLFKIAKFFGVSVAYLLGEGDLEGLKVNVSLLSELSEDGKKQIQDFIDFVVQREMEKKKEQ